MFVVLIKWILIGIGLVVLIWLIWCFCNMCSSFGCSKSGMEMILFRNRMLLEVVLICLVCW